MHSTHRRSALTIAGAAKGLSTARAQTADFPNMPLRIIVPNLCRHPGERHDAIQFAAGDRAAGQRWTTIREVDGAASIRGRRALG